MDNKCPRCDVGLVDGIVLAPTVIVSPDFLGESGLKDGCTVRPGPGKVVRAEKCHQCGFSRALETP